MSLMDRDKSRNLWVWKDVDQAMENDKRQDWILGCLMFDRLHRCVTLWFVNYRYWSTVEHTTVLFEYYSTLVLSKM